MHVTGGCQCGRVRFEAEARSDGAELCHCSMCRRAVGNIHMTSFAVRKDSLWWTGQPATYASSPIVTRGFCAHCGTPLYFAYNDSAFSDLMLGAVDEPERFRPANHFGVESRLEAFMKLEGLPEERTEDNDAVRQRWLAATGRLPS